MLFYLENPQSAGPELQSAASSPGLRNFYSAPAKPLALVNVEQPIQVTHLYIGFFIFVFMPFF